MGWIFVPIITVAVIFTFIVYLVALESHRTNYEDTRGMWWFTLICAIPTVLLMMLYAGLSSTVLLSDIFMTALIIVFFALIASVLYDRHYHKKNNVKGKFKKPTWGAVSVLLLFFMLVGITAPAEDQDDTIASNTAADEETVEESEEPTEELTEEEAEETEAERLARVMTEKQANKSDEEKSIEAAEKEKEESIEAEKEESIEEKKAKEESIEKAEAEKEKSTEEEEAAAEAEEEPKEEKVASKEGLIPVTLYSVVDGDTVNVYDDSGQELKLRLLLIDTPETVHPNKPVEPYGKEASARLTQLVNAADQLYIEYDSGAKTDNYDRELVYLYADDVSVHEVLLEEGLARVGYIYEQQKYLSEFRAAEQKAKDQQIGIWSIPGYVNVGGEGFNSEEPEPEPEPTNEPATSEPATSEPATSEPVQAPEIFDNCDHLRGTYPTGVPKGHKAYQSKMDRDNDGYACEVS